MSYLNALRLHFAGQFQANVSTVNNDPGHFDNATFVPSDQQMQGPNFDPPNGWFNPQGDAAFRLLGCKVTSAFTTAGPAKPDDAVLQCLVMDSDGRAPAKMVDLDSEQQMVSEIWGLTVRITDAQGNALLSADFEPAAFTDIWFRAPAAPPGSDAPAGAMWQSVLKNLKWGDIGGSKVLQDLKTAADASGLLSIKFNLDGINMDFTSPDFMCGRIVGTIGPVVGDEPHHLVMGRQFMASDTLGNQSFFKPVHHINFCVARVDGKSIFLDLGNALPTGAVPGGPPASLGDLKVSVAGISLGTIPASGANGYTGANWYPTTAGVVVLTPHLSDDQWKQVSAHPMKIEGNSGNNISEWSSGAFVRADTFVYRMSPKDSAGIDVYATQFGNPLANASIGFQLDPSQLQQQDVPVAVPAEVLMVGTTPISNATPVVKTDGNGKATLTVTAGDPGNARMFNNGQDYGIDGQVYGLRPGFTDASLNTGPVNASNFVSFLVWSGFTTGTTVSWNDIAPTMQQYANLYPVMNRFLDLGNPDSVIANAGLLQLAFGLDPDDPNSMPVTRDLSLAKRKAIQAWLANPAHPMGQPVVMAAARTVSRRVAVKPAQQGGKAAAMARRVALQSK